MRSRSGAIHSDSTEDFLIIAQLSQSKNGIFYDESTNKKIMNQIQKTHKHKKQQKIDLQSSPSNETLAQNVFKDFNFKTQSEEKCQQLQELAKKVSNISKVIVLGIIAKSISNLKSKIINQMTLELDSFEQNRYLDLLVVRKQQLLFKIWMFQEHQTQEYHLLKVYFDHCHVLCKQADGNYLLQSQKGQDYLRYTQILLPFLCL